MVNFVCQLDWAMGYPDIWPNIILGLSVSGFQMRLMFEWGRLSKADCPPYCGWPSSIHLKA